MALHRNIYETSVQGTPFKIEISELAGQANAALLGHWGETVVLATVVMGGEAANLGYFPLTVDYEERFYAAGKILGSRFVRREGRPSDEAMLSGRLIDRTIRPLFDARMRREIQVTITVLSYDGEHDPDLVSLIAVSTVLGVSDIPWGGPVGAAMFEKKESEEKVIYKSFFAGTEGLVNMIEFEGNQISETELVSLFAEGEQEIARLVAFQKKIISEIGKPKQEISFALPDPRLRDLVSKFLKGEIQPALEKKELAKLKQELMAHLSVLGEEAGALKVADNLFEEEIDYFVHELAITKEKRVDGRALDEIRDLYAEAGVFERMHGSALFIRGNTQLLAVATLGPPSAEQLVETMETSTKKRFMLHYNFPNFSVGETGRSRGPGRREIGHGALAAKALRALIPSKEEFPYAIRIVAETLSSNGSSSMATTCSSSLALMDAGVPFKKHVAGIALGLMMEQNSKSEARNPKYKILTDIQGPEDHHGDMDFKVAGTADGVTAIQMDVKIGGITKEVFEEALSRGKKARLQILEVMNRVLPAPRGKLSDYAPRIFTLHIDPTRIGELIGPGGKTINGIIADAGGEVSIDIDEDGTVYVASEHKERADKAIAMVQGMFREFIIGETLEGTVVRIMEFGAIVSLGGKQDGMVHVSELGQEGFVKNVSDVVKMGQRVKVRVVKIENGRVGLSMKGVVQS